LKSKIVGGAESEQPVWPSIDGNTRGSAPKPLYETVPQAAADDPKLYELLALIDAVRIGRVRERSLAAKELKLRIEGS
jgi:hypothetical protein